MIAQASFIKITSSLMFWTLISFLLLLFLLKKYALPVILKIIYDREYEIFKKNKLAKRNLIKSKKLKLKQNNLLKKFYAEYSQKIENANLEAQKIKDKYIQSGLKDIQKEKEELIIQMDLMKNKMLNDLNKHIIFLSLEIAKELVKKELSEKENIQLIKKLIDEKS